MNISELSIKRPVFAWMLMFGLIVFGGISFMRMGISQLPDVDYPVVSVNVRLEGAAPEVIETSVVDIIENAVMTIQSIRSVSSRSENSEGTVTIEFELNRDIDLAVQDVQAKVAAVMQKLPKDTLSPTIRKSNPEDQPIMLLTLESDRFPLKDLMAYTNDRVKNQFSTVAGVGDITLGGYRDPNLRVWVDGQPWPDAQQPPAKQVTGWIAAAPGPHRIDLALAVSGNGQALQLGLVSADEEALPPPAPEGEQWSSQVETLRKQVEDLESKERQELGELTIMFRGVKDDQTAKCNGLEIKINQEIDAEILALEKKRDAALGVVRKVRDEYIEEARQIGVSEAARIRGENAPVREQLTAELATAEERARQHERTEGTREAAIVARREATDKKANSEILTESLTRLKDLRLKVAERLPIKNIRIQDGRLFNLDKVAFKRWNTVQQLVFCLKIAVIAHREAGFVCVDNFEHFDTQMKEAALAACRKYAEDEGMQFILCAVSDEPELKVVEG